MPYRLENHDIIHMNTFAAHPIYDMQTVLNLWNHLLLYRTLQDKKSVLHGWMLHLDAACAYISVILCRHLESECIKGYSTRADN
jgi:hypothetical protein